MSVVDRRVADDTLRALMRMRDRAWERWASSPAARWQSEIVTALALLLRMLVVIWSAGRFPATADGEYYQKLAERISTGQGYTWLWPDGVVTPAAHYPVGYPALLSVGHLIAGHGATVAAVINALVGTVGVWAIHGMVFRSAGKKAALAAGFLSAIDPALVLYTPAVMTEGVTASLLACAALVATVGATRTTQHVTQHADQRAAQPTTPHTTHGSWIYVVITGVVLGLATLVRPQSLLLAPLFGLAAIATSSERSWSARATRRLGAAVLTTVMCVAVCLPWTARNCVQMKRCALVSVNGGWNLLIGTNPDAKGHWASIEVPDECKNVFDEAGKDVCFSNAARRQISDHPVTWLRLIPAKLGATFDAAVAAPWYLHASNPVAFPEDAKRTTQAVEIAFHRALLLGSLLLLLARRPLPVMRSSSNVRDSLLAVVRSLDVTSRIVAAVGLIFCFVTDAWPAYIALAAAFLLLALHPRGETPTARIEGFFPLTWLSASVILGTAIVHAAFFGAGRYSLVIFPFVTACAGALLTSEPVRSDSASPQPAGLPPSA